MVYRLMERVGKRRKGCENSDVFSYDWRESMRLFKIISIIFGMLVRIIPFSEDLILYLFSLNLFLNLSKIFNCFRHLFPNI